MRNKFFRGYRVDILPQRGNAASNRLKATEKQFADLSEHSTQLMMCCRVCGHDHGWLSMRPRLFIDVTQITEAA
jgi:hypothetical protein